MTTWQMIIAALAADRESGSWAITRRAAAALGLAAAEGATALRAAIRALLAAQPAMAALWNLANVAAWAAAERQDPAAAARGFVAAGDAGLAAIAEHATDRLRAARRAVTISAGATVEAALRAWAGPVLVLESRPRGEGRALAGRLAGAGQPVVLAVDAAGRALLEPGDVILLGADSVTPAGVTNKIGSWLLAAGARERGLACYALAGQEKWWPAPLSEGGEADHDPREVLAELLPGVQIRNPYFELVPPALLTAIVTAGGPRSPEQVAAALGQWRVHPWLDRPSAPSA